MKKHSKWLIAAILSSTVLAGCSKEDLLAPQTQSIKTTNDLSYSYLPAKPAVEVSVGGESGIPYILSTELESNGGHKVYIGSNNTNPSWTYLSGPGAIKIAASESDRYFGGRYYIITPGGEIYRYAGGSWENFSANHGGMLASDIDVIGGGSSRDNRYELDIYILGTTNIPGGHPVYRFDFANNTWTQVGSQGGVSITLDAFRRVWITDDQNYIYRNDVNSSTIGWQMTTGRAIDVSSHTGLKTYVLGATTNGYNEVFSQPTVTNPNNYGWIYEGGYGKQIAAGPNDELWVVSYDNSLWRSQ